ERALQEELRRTKSQARHDLAVAFEPIEDVEIQSQRYACRDLEVAGPCTVIPKPNPRAQAGVHAQMVACAVARLPKVIGVDAGPFTTWIEPIAANEAAQAKTDAQVDSVCGASPELERQPGRRAGDETHTERALDPHLGRARHAGVSQGHPSNNARSKQEQSAHINASGRNVGIRPESATIAVRRVVDRHPFARST